MPNKVTIDDKSPSFDTADQAANALSATLDDGSHKIERAGMLYAGSDGKYKYSTTITGSHDNFALAATIPPGYKLAGIVHAHPGKDEDGQMFSPDDVQVANRLNLPSYVRFLNSGDTRKYVPGKTETKDFYPRGASYPSKAAVGDPLELPQPSTTPPATPTTNTPAPSSPPVTARDSDITHYLFT
jgi:Domain of unknown function (DUF4329)